MKTKPTLTQNVARVSFLRFTPPTQRTINQLHEATTSSQGVVSSQEANNNPGLCPAQLQDSGLYSRPGVPVPGPCGPVLSMLFQLFLLFLNKFSVV